MAIIRSQCGGCSVGCGVRCVTGDGRSLIVEGDKTHPANGGQLCARAERLQDDADPAGRLLYPIVDGRRQKWERAVAQVAQRLSATIARYGAGAVALHVGGELLTEDIYVANKLMKGFVGSAHIHAPGAETPAAMNTAAYGEDVSPAAAEDIDQARLILIIGDHLADRHPILIKRMLAARERGAILAIVADEEGTDGLPCDIRLTVAPGSEHRLVAGLLLHCHDAGVRGSATVVAEDYWTKLRAGHDLWSVARACGLAAAQLRSFYETWVGQSETVTIYGDDDVELAAAVIDLHLATGRIGRPGAVPYPCAARPGGMSIRETGCLPAQLAAHLPFSAAAVVARFWGARSMAQQPGLSGAALLAAAQEGQIKALWSIGSGAADQAWLDAMRRAVPFTIRSTSSVAEAQEVGWSVLLPSPVWAEKDGTLTSADRLISRHRRLLDLPGEAKPDWWGLTKVAQAMGWGDAFHYERPADIYREHARLTAYGNDGGRLLNLRRHASISNPAYDELTPWRWGEAPFRDGRFPTPDGRARLLPLPIQRDATMP